MADKHRSRRAAPPNPPAYEPGLRWVVVTGTPPAALLSPDGRPPIIAWRLLDQQGAIRWLAAIDATDSEFFAQPVNGAVLTAQIAETVADLWEISGAPEWSADSVPCLLDLPPARLARLVLQYPRVRRPIMERMVERGEENK